MIVDEKANDVNTDENFNDEKNDETVDLRKEIETLKEKLKESNEKYIRIYADFDNFRRRTQKEKAEFLELAEKNLVYKLLPVLDDFNRAIEVDKGNCGLILIWNNLNKILTDQGLEKISVNKGDAIDFKIHEVVSKEVVHDKKSDNVVVRITEDGYIFRSRMLRHSKVTVGTYSEKNQDKSEKNN